ncbi:MAG: 5-formyltetrahydrofolate cyclo-ligase [Thermodesulfobacteriota bacterium]
MSRGALAEILRGTPIYRGARTVFVSPSPLLGQVRINVLADGKNLLMPSPGLKEGFLLLAGSRVPRGRLAYAATPAGMAELGQRLDIEFPERFLVDLLVHEVLAVDRQGCHLGDGQGFFDLSLAILAAAGGLAAGWQAVAVAPGNGLNEQDLPREPWDMPAHAALAGGMHYFGQAVYEPLILWPQLTRKRIRKISPLWKLFRRMEEGSPGE